MREQVFALLETKLSSGSKKANVQSCLTACKANRAFHDEFLEIMGLHILPEEDSTPQKISARSLNKLQSFYHDKKSKWLDSINLYTDLLATLKSTDLFLAPSMHKNFQRISIAEKGHCSNLGDSRALRERVPSLQVRRHGGQCC